MMFTQKDRQKMMFNYSNFLHGLCDNEDETKRELYRKKLEFSNSEKIEDEPFYSYLTEFTPLKYRTSRILEGLYNWDLLLQMIASSFSSSCFFDFEDFNDKEPAFIKKTIPELIVCVNNGNRCYIKKISELNSSQISILHNMYMEELINHQHMQLRAPVYVMQKKKMRIQLYKKQYYMAEKIMQSWNALNGLKYSFSHN